MPVGITNTTTVTIQNLTDIANVSSFPELLININHVVYNGWLYFLLLWVLWIIFFMVGMQADALKGKPLVNLMYGGAVVSIISFVLRAVYVTQEGVIRGLLSDFQMWVFPILTIIIATAIWGINKS